MAASSGSLDTSSNSNPTTFSFTNQYMFNNSNSSFTDHLGSDDHDYSTSTSTKGSLSARIAERNGGSGVPKFKSFPPPSLPMISSPCVSPSSYFAIPPGLTPAELLDSPVLLSQSYLLPSPTTGSFPFQSFNWKNDSFITQNQNIKEEKDKDNYSDFSFHTETKPATSNSIPQGQQAWNYQEPAKVEDKNRVNNQNSRVIQSEYNNYNQSTHTIKGSKKSDDGYNWRKYGQKQVKGSENPRSYYKCTFPNCSTKKKVEIRSSDGQITEIVYKGTHNHPKPQSTRRSSLTSAPCLAIQPYNPQPNEVPEQIDSFTTPENSCISVGDDDYEQSSQNNRSVGDDLDEDEPDAKRWKTEGESEEISVTAGSRTVKEPRVVVQTRSDIDILDDGYRWRKYGQKVVKGNPNPRSYYKCTTPNCCVRKHVERAGHDIRSVITTYEGKHNHDVPVGRGGSHSLNRPVIPTTNVNNNGRIQSNNNNNEILMLTQTPYTLEMFQNPGSFNYMNQPQDNMFSRAKEEPRDRDDTFFESLLC